MVTSQPVFPQALKKFLILLFLAAIALPLAAQTGLGVVHGTVTDQSRAVIPNAKVTLTNTATGVMQTVQTTEVGAFYFGSVQIGPYTVTVEVAHFKKYTGTLLLEAGQDAVVDPAMEVGASMSPSRSTMPPPSSKPKRARSVTSRMLCESKSCRSTGGRSPTCST
jgi:hypothetical protein